MQLLVGDLEKMLTDEYEWEELLLSRLKSSHMLPRPAASVLSSPAEGVHLAQKCSRSTYAWKMTCCAGLLHLKQCSSGEPRVLAFMWRFFDPLNRPNTQIWSRPGGRPLCSLCQLLRCGNAHYTVLSAYHRVSWPARMSVWMISGNWLPHECQHPGFPSRVLQQHDDQCYSFRLSVSGFGWSVYISCTQSARTLLIGPLNNKQRKKIPLFSTCSNID